MSASPDLGADIERALARSAWFVLLASPEAARSVWVGREIRWWRQHRSMGRVLLVHTHGKLDWPTNAPDFTSDSDALPPDLVGAFTQPPRFVSALDVSAGPTKQAQEHAFDDVVADVTARIRNVDKDVLWGEHIRIQLIALRTARRRNAILSIVAILALVAFGIAAVQRSDAVAQANLAVARQLASTADGRLGSDLDVAQLLAVAAFRKNPDPQTRAALWRATLASPHLVRYVPFPAEVTAIQAGADGRSIAVGLADGRVARWNPELAAPESVMQLPGKVDSIAISTDGGVIVASGGDRAMVSRSGQPPAEIAVQAETKASGVAVSPSGRTVAVHTSRGSALASVSETTVVDVASGRTTTTKPSRNGDLLRLPSDDEILALSEGYGTWDRHRIADWSVLGDSGDQGVFGTYDFSVATSRDGRFFSYSNGGDALSVFPTTARMETGKTGLEAQAPVNYPDALALSPDGSQAAVAESGTIYVTPVARTGTPRSAPIALPGNGSINSNGIAFSGDGSRLVSASGSRVALWDLHQLDRSARVLPTADSTTCRGCAAPPVIVSPDGTRAATVDSFGSSIAVQTFDAQPPQIIGDNQLLSGPSYAPPLWDADDDHLVAPTYGRGAADNVPATATSWPVGDGAKGIATAMTPDHQVVTLTDYGAVLTQDPTRGQVIDRIAGPVAGLDTGAVSSDGALAVLVSGDVTTVVDRATHRTTARVPGTADRVAFADGRLLVQRPDGSLEIWTADGTARLRVVAGDRSLAGRPPVGSATGSVVARRHLDGTLDLVDLDSGALIGTLPSPGGIEVAKTGVGFRPDGQTLVSVSPPDDVGPSTMVVRDLSDDTLVARACTTAGRDLTPEEWDTFVGTDRPDDLRCR